MVKFYVRICSFFIFITCLFSASLSYGQVELKGSVSDTLGNPIPHALVLVQKDSSNKIISYTQSDTEGNFTLKIRSTGILIMVVNAMSYKSKEYTFKVAKEISSPLIQDVVLESEPIIIKEINVQANQPISLRGDTISFNAEDFMVGDETVVEEFLKNLPGVEVDEEGVIRFTGKEIEKVMIDDSDLFGKGYSLITKNLDARIIDKVEVLQKYSESPRLKGLEDSDKVALNLTLKEDVVKPIFGNTMVGVNTSNNYEARVVLMSLNKRLKQYSFLNLNKLGYDPIGNISHFLYSDNEQEKRGVIEKDVKPLINLGEETPVLDDRRSRFNHSGMASYNVIYKPSKKFELKVLSFAMFNEDDFEREGVYKYELENISIEDTEDYNLVNNVKNGFARIEALYEPAINAELKYGGYLTKTNGNGRADYIFNSTRANQYITNDKWETSHNLNYTLRLTDNNALLVMGGYQYDTLYEQFRESPFFPTELFINQEQVSDAIQENQTSLHSLDLQAKLINRLSNNFIIETKAGNIFYSNKLDTDLLLNRNDSSLSYRNVNFINSKKFRGINTFFGIKGRREFTKITISAATDFHNVLYATRDADEDVEGKESIQLIEPQLGLKWNINTKNEIQSSYFFNATSTSIMDAMDNYAFVGDRTFMKGFGRFDIFRGHTFLLNYTYGNWIDRLLFNAVALYSNRNEHLATQAHITPGYNLIGKKLGENQDLLQLNLTTDLYLRSVKNNVKVQTNYFATSSSGSEINNKKTSLKSVYSKYSIELRSVFDFLFNYSIGSSWIHHQQLFNSNIRNSYTDQIQFLDLYFDFSRKIKTKIVLERYYFGQSEDDNTYYYLDGFLSYHIKPDKWQIKFEFRNMLNNNQFRKYVLTDVGMESTLHKTVPRYFLVTLYYRI
ncbi:MAG: hypothetical protein WD059_15700 [Balneolaceae bacterium]